MDSIDYPEKSKHTQHPLGHFDFQGKENLRTHREQSPQKMWRTKGSVLCTASVP